MSREYDDYLTEHKKNVGKGFDWLKANLPDLVMETPGVDWEHQIKFSHDASKDSNEEYAAYDDYFYGGNRSYEVVEKFKYAWLHHIHNNKHHWQYWVLMNDEPDEGTIALEMPYQYVIEMICDWWSFSWKDGNLRGIFDWWNEHRENMVLNQWTEAKVQAILAQIYLKLQEEENAFNAQIKEYGPESVNPENYKHGGK